MKKLKRKAREKALKAYVKTKIILMKNNGFGMNEILGIAAALIIASIVVIPQLKNIAEKIMLSINNWWDTTVSGHIFPKTLQ